MPNCEFCSTYGEFQCKRCFINYSFKHENNIVCSEKTLLEGNKFFYTNDSGINYYSCLLFNEVKNCEECSKKDICDKCKNGYTEYNNNKLCVKKNETDDNNKTKIINDTTLIQCSALIKYCNKCNENYTCHDCLDEAYLIDNVSCILKSIIEKNKNYYKDNSTNRYISCSIIPNCIICDSSTVCTSCEEGFFLNNKICSKIINNKNNDDNDSGLSKGKIIGIVFGCFGFLLLIVGIVFFIINKLSKKNKNSNNITNIEENDKVEIVDDKISKDEKVEKAQENEEKIVENLKQNDIVIHSVKRNIHNVQNNE